MSSIVAFDAVLCIALLGLAAAAILSRVLFRSVILFMVFGLLMALGWARMHAPDIALTEAALGAGLTGALLLYALRAFKSGPQAGLSIPEVTDEPSPSEPEYQPDEEDDE